MARLCEKHTNTLMIENLENEEWKDIAGYEGLYQISNCGRVKSLNYRRTGKEKLLRPATTRDGYLLVCLCKNGQRKLFRVHRLVAFAFSEICGEIFDGAEPDHLDGNRKNNNAENIKLKSHVQNMKNDKTVEKLIDAFAIPVKQLTLEGELVKEWPSAKEAGRNGFSCSSIRRCCQGKIPHHKGFRWERVNDCIDKIPVQRKIEQLTVNNEVVKIWESIREAARAGFNQSAVCLCCKNKFHRDGNIYKGYIWKYL